jgi:hypothetical protein
VSVVEQPLALLMLCVLAGVVCAAVTDAARGARTWREWWDSLR